MTESPGAHVGATGTTFVLWAPLAADVAVVIGDRRHALEPLDDGYWRVFVDGAGDGDTYRYSIDGGDLLPDPASAHQPDGVHGASAIVDPQQFEWSDDEWRGRRLVGTVVYELHVGTFTPAGTLDAAILELPRLSALGVTTVELMPVNGFPGRRNWGYDGVFAVRGPGQLRRTGGARPVRRRRPRPRARRHPRRGVQPPRAGGQLPVPVRPVLHRRVPDAVGSGDQRQRARQ